MVSNSPGLYGSLAASFDNFVATLPGENVYSLAIAIASYKIIRSATNIKCPSFNMLQRHYHSFVVNRSQPQIKCLVPRNKRQHRQAKPAFKGLQTTWYSYRYTTDVFKVFN